MLLQDTEINKKTVAALKKKHIFTINDVVRNTPRAYKNYQNITTIKEAESEKDAAVRGHLMEVRRKGESMRKYIEASLIDENTGETFRVFWFGDYYLYDYIKPMEGANVIVCGKLTYKPSYGYSITNPDVFSRETEFIPRIIPVYSKYQGVSEKMLKKITFEALKEIKDPLEAEVVSKTGILGYKEALYCLHCPKSEEEILKGKKRMLFNDLLYFSMEMAKRGSKRTDGFLFEKSEQTKAFIASLPFEMTPDQKKAVETAMEHARKGERNNLLIQGDVGCGKTVVAFSMMVLAVENGYQAVLTAPTQVLAEQHYLELSKYMEKMGHKVAYLHSGLKAAEKKKLLAGIVAGEYPIIVGTHSVFSDNVMYNNLGLVITDEEHKFGVKQKEALKEKADSGCHLISMSATPIPRSLAGIVFGEDKEICVIKSMPKGRIPVQTAIQIGHSNTFPFMEKQIREGHQCYVVCPAIDNQSDAEGEEKPQIKNIEEVKQEYDAYFSSKGIRIGVVHGKMKKDEIAATIEAFTKNEIQILMSTTVIEVGVNVPNATVMVVEQADRFGLASLHQLRGRVGRGSFKAYCILISDDKTNERLLCMTQTTDGFEIAEKDLELRGGGDLIGTRQSGSDKYISEILAHPEFYEAVKKTAKKCIDVGYGEKLCELYREHEQAEGVA